MKLRHWITAIVLLPADGCRRRRATLDSRLARSKRDAYCDARQETAWRAKDHAHDASLVDVRPLQTRADVAAIAGTQKSRRWPTRRRRRRSRSRPRLFRRDTHCAAKPSAPLARSQRNCRAQEPKPSKPSKKIRTTSRTRRESLRGRSGSQKDNLQDQIDVAKAQLELDQDELDDASEDLEQAGGDPEA